MTIQHPTIPGKVDGIISLEPPRAQCRGCGLIEEAESFSALVTLSPARLRFHPGWDTGRLCRACRLARGCICPRCQEERNDETRTR